MTYRKAQLATGEFFHIYNRGNSKQDIFLDEKDRDHFVKLLYLCNSSKQFNFRDDIVDKKIDTWDFERGDQLVSIGAWALMPNHFHIYLVSPTPSVGETNISLFIRKLSTSYAKYFNKKYNRTGSLFEGNFKATHVENDNQAKYLFSYIHLNSLKLIDSNWKENGVKDIKKSIGHLNNYKWSSFLDHKGIKRNENKILQLENFPKYFSNSEEIDSEIFSWLQQENN